jgi:D-alanine-D-alanine ligase
MDMIRNSPARRAARVASASFAGSSYPHSHRWSLGPRSIRALGTSFRAATVARFDPLDVTPMLRGPGALGRSIASGPFAGALRAQMKSSGEQSRPTFVRTVGIAYDLKADFEKLATRTIGDAELPEDAFEEYDSDATVAAIEEALASHGYRTRRLGSGRSFLGRVMHEPGELVFNIAEGYGTRSREAHVPSALEMLGIPYTHSDPLTLALTLDKAMAKRVVASAGVPTPRFAVVESVEQAEDLPLRYPLIAKPLFEGSSMGVRKHSRVTDAYSLRELVRQLLADYREPVLVEEFACGPEFTVGILGTGAGAQVLGTMEIVPKNCAVEEFVYSLEVKRNYLEEVEYHAPPRREGELVRSVEEVALAAYRALACRDVGRVDVRLGDDGEPKFLEINPLPGLNPVTGDLVILARANGLGYADLIGRIVESARERQGI